MDIKTENKFWEYIAEHVFEGRVSDKLKDNINVIIDSYYAYRFGSKYELTYILATVRHECYHPTLNPDMNPIREGFAKTNQGAINAVTKLYQSGKIKKNYALPDAQTGQSYYGRGYAQITHKVNYEILGKAIDVDLANHPDKALEPEISAKILVVGSTHGLFTGKKISDYITEEGPDYYNMRRVINGLDKADLIAGYAKEIEHAIKLGLS